MTALRPRLRALAALVALCLSVGPAASALCPHADAESHEAMGHEAMGHGEMPTSEAPPSTDAPPCHEEPAPEPQPEDADCASPCCAVASAPTPAPAPAVELSVSAVLPGLALLAEVRTGEATVEMRVPPRVPPDGAHWKTTRLRV